MLCRPLIVPCAALLLAGCASPRPPEPSSSGTEAAEEARRSERQRIMQEFWAERTAATPHPDGIGPGPGPSLSYPAGFYGGVRFAPRQAADSSLAEPAR